MNLVPLANIDINSTHCSLWLSATNTHTNINSVCVCNTHHRHHQMSTNSFLLLLPSPSLSRRACSLLAVMDSSTERSARLLKLRANWTRNHAARDGINLEKKERQGKWKIWHSYRLPLQGASLSLYPWFNYEGNVKNVMKTNEFLQYLNNVRGQLGKKCYLITRSTWKIVLCALRGFNSTGVQK